MDFAGEKNMHLVKVIGKNVMECIELPDIRMFKLLNPKVLPGTLREILGRCKVNLKIFGERTVREV